MSHEQESASTPAPREIITIQEQLRRVSAHFRANVPPAAGKEMVELMEGAAGNLDFLEKELERTQKELTEANRSCARLIADSISRKN